MAADLVRFVDSIAASPTVRLDLNDETSWWVRSFKAPPPRLRRSQSSNAMRDGIHVGSSTYGERTVTLELQSIKSTQDLGATEIQKLWRELDRADNYLMYQPTGATKPVFFRLYRSDSSTLEDVVAQAANRTITVELLAEPFAMGLRETLGPYTVNNDPAAGSNPMYFDVSGVLGDVAVRPVLWWSGGTRNVYLTATHAAAAIAAPNGQAESASFLFNDTTNPGGGPDAAMSGTGTNNFVRTTFATVPTIATRVQFVGFVPLGSWRVIVGVRRSSATGTITVRALMSSGSISQETADIETAFTTNRRVLDLGVMTAATIDRIGEGAVVNTATAFDLNLRATRVSGTSTLDWDYVRLIPVGGQVGELVPPQSLIATDVALSFSPVIDGTRDLLASWSGGDPSVGTSTISARAVAMTGTVPSINPGLVNRVHVVHEDGSFVHTKSTALTVNLAYWPRYLFVRPSAS